MSLENAITQLPRPFDPEKGSEVAALVLGVSKPLSELLTGAAGCSPYLAGLIQKHSDWLPEAMHDPTEALRQEYAKAQIWSADDVPSQLRLCKQRVALLTGLADLCGAWSLQDVTKTLSDFADMACDTAIRQAIAQQIKRKKLPAMTEDDIPTAGGMCILAMGKMGAAELNYSSDIDLICLFDETRLDPDDYLEARQAFVRATRTMCATLSEMTANGYVFRTDLRLRPDPSVTPVTIAMEAAENYYESLGRTWERAAYIKARPAAGDKEAGARFLKALTPFVWRRHLDFAAIQDAHDMRLAIREHKGLGGPITLPGHNMKLGRGGIREIEFFTQTRQLIAGGRDPDLRCRGTIDGLEVLSRKGWVEPETAAALAEHYTAHRTVEHRLQMVQDAQTHSLPHSSEGFARLAAMMDMDVTTLEADLNRRLAEVHELTEGFFAPSAPAKPKEDKLLDTEMLNRWMSYPALRSARSREIFERVRPQLVAKLQNAARPQEALAAFDGFLSGLPAGVQLFSLLDANPQLTDLLIDITGTSPALAQYLSRNAAVFDAVIGGDFFSDWPGQQPLQDMLNATLAAESDYETRLDQTRRWTKEWHFRIGVHLLRGVISAQEARFQYSDLARAVVAVIWPVVTDQFSLRYGAPPGRGAVILGMGSIGAGTLTAGSDLDLIVIYDPLAQEMSDGAKQLATRPYYARLTQSLITALSAPMSQGKLFEVDMRLRPSGNQGPVATSWESFQSYQETEAWVWEHLALVRARVIAGPSDLAADIEAFRQKLMHAPSDTRNVLTEVRQMRSRIHEAKAPQGVWDVKVGRGRLQDIELLAQAGALLASEANATTTEGLQAAAKCDLLTPEAADTLIQAADLLSDVHTGVRLLSQAPLMPETLGPLGADFLLRTYGHNSLSALEETLEQSYAEADSLISDALQRALEQEGSA